MCFDIRWLTMTTALCGWNGIICSFINLSHIDPHQYCHTLMAPWVLCSSAHLRDSSDMNTCPGNDDGGLWPAGYRQNKVCEGFVRVNLSLGSDVTLEYIKLESIKKRQKTRQDISQRPTGQQRLDAGHVVTA